MRNIVVIAAISAVLYAPGSISADNICEQKDSAGTITFLNCNTADDSARKVELEDANVATPDNSPVSASPAQKDVRKSKNKGKELEQAKRDLEEAKQVREGDRQKTKTGSRLNESYHQRVQQAEKRVEALE